MTLGHKKRDHSPPEAQVSGDLRLRGPSYWQFLPPSTEAAMHEPLESTPDLNYRSYSLSLNYKQEVSKEHQRPTDSDITQGTCRSTSVRSAFL